MSIGSKILITLLLIISTISFGFGLFRIFDSIYGITNSEKISATLTSVNFTPMARHTNGPNALLNYKVREIPYLEKVEIPFLTVLFLTSKQGQDIVVNIDIKNPKHVWLANSPLLWATYFFDGVMFLFISTVLVCIILGLWKNKKNRFLNFLFKIKP